MIPDSARRQSTLIVSTGGKITAAGIEQLQSVAAALRCDPHRHEETPLYLIDAGTTDEESLAVVRAETLREMACVAGLTYYRYAPEHNKRDQNETFSADGNASQHDAIGAGVSDDGGQNSSENGVPDEAATLNDEPEGQTDGEPTRGYSRRRANADFDPSGPSSVR